MPAVSEPLRLPHTWRPFGARIAGILFGTMLLVVSGAAWFGFDDETRAKFTLFQRGTLVFLGLIAYAAWFALIRSRVVATEERLVVVNGYRRHEYDWAEIVAARMPPGAPWVTLDLADGTSASALAIQSSDGARAQKAVQALRGLVAASSARRQH